MCKKHKKSKNEKSDYMEENKMLEKDFKQIVESIKSEIYKTQKKIKC